MSPLSFLRRSTSAMAGPEHPAISPMPLLPVGGAGRPATGAALEPARPLLPSTPPPALTAEIRFAESLDEFQALVRRHQADRIYLDVLDWGRPVHGPASASYCVILSASKGAADILALLPWQAEKNGGSVPDVLTYRNVLRSRFLFLGYSVSDGLASARLARHLPAGAPPAASA